MGGRSDVSRSGSPVSRTIHWLATTLAVTVAIILPAGYFATSFQYLSGVLQSEAEFTAGAVSRLVNANPESWQFQAHNLDRALIGDRPHDVGTRRIFLAGGRLIGEHSVSLASPTVRRQAPVFDAGLPVGYVEAEETIRPVLVRTGAVAILGLGLGAAVFVVLVLPLRALQRSEEQFSLLAQSAPDGIVLVDGTGRIASWNAGAQTIFGLSEAEAVGRPAIELFTDSDRARYRELLSEGVRAAAAAGSGRSSAELTGRRRDGAEVPLEVALATWSRGAAVGHTHVIRDISERRWIALEQARLFKESEHRRRTAEALAEVGRLLSQTLDPRVVGARIVESVESLLAVRSAILYTLEPSSGALTAHTVSTDLGPHHNWTRRLDRGVGIAWLALDQRCPIMTPDVLEDDRVVLSPDIRNRLAPSAHRALLAVPLAAQDRIVGALVVADGTGRVYSETDERLAQTFAAHAAIALENARLYQDVQRAYDDLSHTQAQLAQAQKMEAVGHLAGGIAHDFNSLLTVILGRSALLLDELPSGSAARRSIERIQKAADRAALLTRQILAFSRRQVLQPTALDVNRVVADLLPMLRSLAGGTIELTALLEVAPAFVRADQAQLEQVIINVVVNAREAMPQGGELTIRTATADLDADPDLPPGPYVRLAVTDTGHGMTEAIRARVFEPFFTTKRVGEGPGLGLSMAYGIIGQHGGTMAVESQEGQGSTFTVYLPRIDANDVSSPPSPSVPAGT